MICKNACSSPCRWAKSAACLINIKKKLQVQEESLAEVQRYVCRMLCHMQQWLNRLVVAPTAGNPPRCSRSSAQP